MKKKGKGQDGLAKHMEWLQAQKEEANRQKECVDVMYEAYLTKVLNLQRKLAEALAAE